MKQFVLLATIICVCGHASLAQGLFSEKFKECAVTTPCFYCGDTPAHYSKPIVSYIIGKINSSVNNSNYILKNFDVQYEMLIDSSGHTCVTSIQSLGFGFSWQIKDDIRKWLTNMPDWQPAKKDGKSINSSVILKLKFVANMMQGKFVEPPVKKDK